MTTLRQIIKNQGVTNKVVADALGIESTNIGRYDDLSKRKLSELITISKSLNMSLSELIQQSVSDDVELEEVTIINKPKYTEKVEENARYALTFSENFKTRPDMVHGERF